MSDVRFYLPGEAAKAAGVSTTLIRLFCDSGRLKAFRTATGRRLIPASEVERLLKERQEKGQAALPAPA